jgi:hypothetical protein
LQQSDVAMVASGGMAVRRADIWLQDLWAGRESASFALPPSRLSLAPGDVVALTCGARRRLFEIRDIVDTETRKVRARSIDPDIFEVPVEPIAVTPPVIPPALGPVQVRLLDLPARDSTEPVTLTQAAVFADPWPGPVALWRSRDGSSYQQAGLASAPAIVGETLDALPPGPLWRFDDASVLRVRVYGGMLSSVSDEALLNGANVAALQRPDGACEIVQFARAELVGERTYALSRLLRGQGGSEWAAAETLVEGASFVLLDAQLLPVASGLDMLGRALSLRAVAARRDHGDATAVALSATPGAVALRPLSPVQLRAQRGVDGVTFSWIRRTRFDGDSWEALEVPLGESAERYEVDILDGATVRRTLSAAEPRVLYPAADEIADFATSQAVLSVRVAQLSATVGRGVAAQAVLSI